MVFDGALEPERVIACVADISTTVFPSSRNGDPIVACSPQLIGRSNASRLSSSLSTYTTFWRYDSLAEREEKRARLQADERWKSFLAKVQPLMHTQQNRILVPTPFSPIR